MTACACAAHGKFPAFFTKKDLAPALLTRVQRDNSHSMKSKTLDIILAVALGLTVVTGFAHTGSKPPP
jgi:hypothetical protein